jgi:hypothetical protein
MNEGNEGWCLIHASGSKHLGSMAVRRLCLGFFFLSSSSSLSFSIFDRDWFKQLRWGVQR